MPNKKPAGSSNGKLNGSVDKLAQALHDVLNDSMAVVEDRITAKFDPYFEKIDQQLDDLRKSQNTTNKNMQAQFSQLRKDMAKTYAKKGTATP